MGHRFEPCRGHNNFHTESLLYRLFSLFLTQFAPLLYFNNRIRLNSASIFPSNVCSEASINMIRCKIRCNKKTHRSLPLFCHLPIKELDDKNLYTSPQLKKTYTTISSINMSQNQGEENHHWSYCLRIKSLFLKPNRFHFLLNLLVDVIPIIWICNI